MRRRCGDALAVLLLLAWLFVAGMTGRSLYWRDTLIWGSPMVTTAAGTSAKGLMVVSSGCALWIEFESGTWNQPKPARVGNTYGAARGISFVSRSIGHDVTFEGFWANRYVDHQSWYRNQVWLVRIPWWAILIVATIPAVVAGNRFRRRWRASRAAALGYCPTCAYDLRASPERCPECGIAVPSQPTRPPDNAVAS